ncbi:hypothetical protein ACFLZ2_04265 [Candidatus Margulisiibacteriota bacterium]
MAKKRKSKKLPKLRAWGVPSRKTSTMVIPSKKEKAASRPAGKHQTKKEIREAESLFKDKN